jgi:hypothetical protein
VTFVSVVCKWQCFLKQPRTPARRMCYCQYVWVLNIALTSQHTIAKPRGVPRIILTKSHNATKYKSKEAQARTRTPNAVSPTRLPLQSGVVPFTIPRVSICTRPSLPASSARTTRSAHSCRTPTALGARVRAVYHTAHPVYRPAIRNGQQHLVIVLERQFGHNG